ncbi:fatty acid desaturase [Pararhizobium sp.]|uniref:fatty acid desaturase n=1 Tax=Pararhizobium sp. TaxID=1977563 RepID=UPI00271A9280|nr:fatty acid desaturase [Pararhizobium sp.]MDO9415206.1 fatty acid desaturase [Pararhizobium sp.]
MTTAPRSWVARLSPYMAPENGRAVFETLVTVIPFAGLWAAMVYLETISIFLALPLVLPAAGLMVRLFIIQHDCGHGAMFTSKTANDWLGRTIGVLTLTPYDYWRHTHALHHASSGNLDKRGFGDIDTLTLEEYRALDRMGRLKYRLYRHPAVMFGLGPAYLFLVQHRLPLGAMNKGHIPWTSTLATNAGILALYAILIYFVGFWTFLLIQFPVILIGASAGVWLFYVQHQFEEAHWERTDDWDRANAALHGSSFYDLPQPLMWFTGNIGIHHVHHLSSRIPFHKLPQILKDHPELKTIGRLTLWQSIKCVRLTLWDEQAKKLISFREAARRIMPAQAAAA